MDIPSHPTNRLWGRSLRFVLVAEIRRRRTMTVAEMTEFVHASGFMVAGRPSKEISDALRWEVARGRLKRLARGVYGYGRTPRTTARRIGLFARRCHAWLNATARGETPPPTPPTPPERSFPWPPADNPERPPWEDLGWLWVT